MYCKYCGRQIDPATMRCRICGRPVGPLEGGSGFWDLTGEQPAPGEGGTAAAQNAAELQSLRRQVEQLRKELEERPVEKKKGGFGVEAALIALLALAVGAFALLQLRGLSGRVEDLSLRLNQLTELSQPAEPEDGEKREETGTEEVAKEGEEPQSGETVSEASEEPTIEYLSSPGLFRGPTRGENDTDPRGQGIDLGPHETEDGLNEIWIFTSIFTGRSQDPGAYEYYWVKVNFDADGNITDYTRLEEPDYRDDVEQTKDGQRHMLIIVGDVKEEQLGSYAFVAENGARAYVSQVVRLYDRRRPLEEDTASFGN